VPGLGPPPPPPPPADVTVEKVELVPEIPGTKGPLEPAAPPPPTVIGILPGEEIVTLLGALG
jgi:hypothetical protein